MSDIPAPTWPAIVCESNCMESGVTGSPVKLRAPNHKTIGMSWKCNECGRTWFTSNVPKPWYRRLLDWCLAPIIHD